MIATVLLTIALGSASVSQTAQANLDCAELGRYAEVASIIKLVGLSEQDAVDAAEYPYKALVRAVYAMPVATKADAERNGQTIRAACLIKRGVL